MKKSIINPGEIKGTTITGDQNTVGQSKLSDRYQRTCYRLTKEFPGKIEIHVTVQNYFTGGN